MIKNLSLNEKIKQLKDFQDPIFSSNLDIHLIATKISILQDYFSPKDIDRQLILSFSLNYQRISILANFLSEAKIDDLIHFDHEFFLQLLKNNIVFKSRYPFYTNVIDDTFNGIDYVEILETYIEKDLYEELKKKNELDDNLIKGINRDSLKIKEKTKIEEIIEEDDIDNFRLLSNEYNLNEMIQ